MCILRSSATADLKILSPKLILQHLAKGTCKSFISNFQGLAFKPEVSEAWEIKLRTLTYLSTLVDMESSFLKNMFMIK